MVRGCFISNKLAPLLFIDRTININIYIQLLGQNLIPFIDLLCQNVIHNVAFEQDNAPPHGARATQDWLNADAKQHRFTIMDFPRILQI